MAFVKAGLLITVLLLGWTAVRAQPQQINAWISNVTGQVSR